MSLDIFVEGCENYFSSTYIGFQRFRCEILKGWNSELGDLYQNRFSYLWNNNEDPFPFGIIEMMELFQIKHSSVAIEKINKLLDEYDKPYNEGMKIFIHHSDGGGEITPDECVLLLKSFGRVNPDNFDNTVEENNIWFRKGYNIWMKMLAFAIENNRSIIFD